MDELSDYPALLKSLVLRPPAAGHSSALSAPQNVIDRTAEDFKGA